MTAHYNPITVKDFIEAIRKNGLPQIRGQFYELDSDRNFIGACAVGQARINLKLVKPNKLNEEVYGESSRINYTSKGRNLIQTSIGGRVENKAIDLNDNARLSLDEIADRLTMYMKDVLNAPAYEEDAYYHVGHSYK